MLDGGHNPQCAEALTESIREYVADPGKGEKVTFLIGMLADKDYDTTLELLKPYGANYICITPDSPRALPAAELASEIRRIAGGNASDSGCTADKTEKKDIGGKWSAAGIGSMEMPDSLEQTTYMPSVETCEDISGAIQLAVSKGLPVIAFGSLYSAGDIRRNFTEMYTTAIHH